MRSLPRLGLVGIDKIHLSDDMLISSICAVLGNELTQNRFAESDLTKA